MHKSSTSRSVLRGQLGVRVSAHAADRMGARGLPAAAVAAAVEYGRVVHVRGAAIHAIGRKEVEWHKRDGIELARYEGVQVVCGPGGAIITVYRNRDFRGLRATDGRRRGPRCAW